MYIYITSQGFISSQVDRSFVLIARDCGHGLSFGIHFRNVPVFLFTSVPAERQWLLPLPFLILHGPMALWCCVWSFSYRPNSQRRKTRSKGSMVTIYECEPAECLLDCTSGTVLNPQLPCCSQTGSCVNYKCCHRTAGQHGGIFQESLVLFFLEDAVFSEMELMLIFMKSIAAQLYLQIVESFVLLGPHNIWRRMEI